MKDEAESKYLKEKEVADKLRSNYDVLKEHEMNIIKDFDNKKTREITFYEQTLSDLHKQAKEA